MSLRTDFLAFDDRLCTHGVPRLTDWWREQIGAWLDAYEERHVLELWVAAGRGSAKSTAIYKLATFFTLLGNFVVPVGERHFAIVLSRLKEEAAKGIAIIDQWLTLLDEPHRLAGDVIELTNDRRGIRVVAASVAAASGWRAYFVGKDERSKWQMGGVEEQDAEEIDTSAKAMTATHEFAPEVTGGSAWGAFGGFYDAITGGTNEQRVVIGPVATWIAAPHISKESTRRKEPNERRWRREYACEFQAGVLGAFDHDLIEPCFGRPVPESYARSAAATLIDPTAGSSDTYAYTTVRWRLPPRGTVGGPRLEFDHVGGIERAAASGYTSDTIVSGIVAISRRVGCVAIHGDQFERFALGSAVNRLGFPYFPHTWTAPLKERAVEHVRSWLRDGVLSFPKGAEKMKRELIAFEERIAPSGALTFRGRQGGHDDFAMLVLLAALVDLEGGLDGSPLFAVPRELEAAAERRLEAAMALHRFGEGPADLVTIHHLRPGTPAHDTALRRIAGGDDTDDAAMGFWERHARAMGHRFGETNEEPRKGETDHE